MRNFIKQNNAYFCNIFKLVFHRITMLFCTVFNFDKALVHYTAEVLKLVVISSFDTYKFDANNTSSTSDKNSKQSIYNGLFVYHIRASYLS